MGITDKTDKWSGKFTRWCDNILFIVVVLMSSNLSIVRNDMHKWLLKAIT